MHACLDHIPLHSKSPTNFLTLSKREFKTPLFSFSSFSPKNLKNKIKMRLWKRAAGALKDKYSIWVAKLSPCGPCRNPNLETVIIKATSHDEQFMDYKSLQKVFQWLRISPLYFKPLLYTLSMRMEKTRSWTVALKGLMLIHGIFCFDLPSVQMMGRLPFDLSHFSDRHISSEKAWVFNAFVRSYFAYLDQKSAYTRLEAKKLQAHDQKSEELIEELRSLEKLQGLIDMLLQIKPRSRDMNVVLILEAMDCIVDEVSELYGKFSKGVKRVLVNARDMGGKEEARVALDVIRKGETQGQKITSYFECCRDIGVVNASECPEIVRVAKEDIDEFERIINGGVSENKNKNKNTNNDGNEGSIVIYVRDCGTNATISEQMQLEKGLKTVITDQWEVFDDDTLIDAKENNINSFNGTSAIVAITTNPFLDSLSLVPYNPVYNNHVLPDLISL